MFSRFVNQYRISWNYSHSSYYCFKFWIAESIDIVVISNLLRFINVGRTAWNHRFWAKKLNFCRIVIMMQHLIETTTITVESWSEISINSIPVNFSTCFSILRENFWTRFFHMNRFVFVKTVWTLISIRTFCNILLSFEQFFR